VSAAAGSLEVLRAAERTPVPWKNGGGLTREVVISPPGSDLAAFDWRISIAEIRTPGPFSLFGGIDRLMAVLAGRLSLAIDGRPAITLTPESDPFAFPGELPLVGAPLGAPVTDLNVMTRRSRCAARLMRSSAPRLEPQADTSVLIALAELTFRGAGTELSLLALDALVIRRLPGEPLAVHRGSAPYYLIEIFERPA
jgi:environmental stress-induced protein Ves